MNSWFATSAAEVARFFGVAHATIAQWRREGMPGKPKKYNLSEVYLWKKAREEKLAKDRRDSARMVDPEHEWKKARARLMQLRVEQVEASLMKVEEHDQFIVRLCATFRNGLFAMAPTLNAQMEGLDEISRLDLIEDRFRDLLAAFVNEGSDEGAPTADDAELDSQAEVPGRPEAPEEGEPEPVG